MATDNDKNLYTQINNELGENSTWQQKLNRALELGANTTVIQQITEEAGDDLSWTSELLARNWSKEQVKDLLLANCEHEYFGTTSYNAVTKNYERWTLFDAEELATFLKKAAENSPTSAEQIIRHWNDHFNELMKWLGDRRLYAVVETAVLNLARLGINGRQVMWALKEMNERLQHLAATRLYPDWNTIPFIVDVMCLHQTEPRGAWNVSKLLPNEHWPLQTPTALRWTLLGESYEKGWSNFGRYFRHSDDYNNLRAAVERRGWQFAELGYVTDPKTGNRVEGVVVNNNRTRQTNIYVHDHNGARRERMKIGYKVMVPTDPAKLLINGPHIHAMKTLKPVHTDGLTRVFNYELHPVAPPTDAMLERPDYYFRGDDIVPSK